VWSTFGAEVAKLRACPPAPLALPSDLVVHAAEGLELPALVKGEAGAARLLEAVRSELAHEKEDLSGVKEDAIAEEL